MPSRHLQSPPATVAAVVLLALLILVPACSDDDDPTDPAADDWGEIGDDIHVDDGCVGLVIDTRPILRKGYAAATAGVAFAAAARLDRTIEVDPVTNLAIVSFDTDTLTADELDTFATGTSVSITVADDSKDVLASYEATDQVLDYSNEHLSLDTDLPHLGRPVALREDMPYLLQVEGHAGIVQLSTVCNPDADAGFVPDTVSQQFYAEPVAGTPDVYYLKTYFDSPPQGNRGATNFYPGLQYLCFTSEYGEQPVGLVAEQDPDGWVRFRVRGTSYYLLYTHHVDLGGYIFLYSTGDASRFRLISDVIQWAATDQGTEYHQPIMPPARLDFAFSTRLFNCQPGTMTETIGQTSQMTRESTFSTTESFELFSGYSASLGVTIGFEVTAKVGIDIEGVGEAGEEVSVSEEVSLEEEFTTNSTTTTQRTWSGTESETVEVSRFREIYLEPWTAVEAYDAMKVIDRVTVPFTQVLRVTAYDTRNSAALTGTEIQTQALFSLMGGVVQAVGDDYVDISLRGHVVVRRIFEATTNVEEIVGACD